jgi:hypothetical protein
MIISRHEPLSEKTTDRFDPEMLAKTKIIKDHQR